MLISQQDFLKILTEPQQILLNNKTLKNFIDFLLKQYQEYDHICFYQDNEILFMEDEISFSSYLKMTIDETKNEFQFLFENQSYDEIKDSPPDFQKNIGYIALDTIKIINKWQDILLQDSFSKETICIKKDHSLYQKILEALKLEQKYENLTFEISYTGDLKEIESSEEDSSDLDWI